MFSESVFQFLLYLCRQLRRSWRVILVSGCPCVHASALTEASLWGGRYRIWCLCGVIVFAGCTSQYTMLKWGQISWNEHFCWPVGCTPQGYLHHFVQTWTCLSIQFRTGNGLHPQWLLSLDKIWKHPIFSRSERYPTGLIYTLLIIHYLGHAKLSWTDNSVIFVGCIPQRSIYPTRHSGLKFACHSQDCGMQLIMYLW